MKKKILLVDDERELVEIVKASLELVDYEVVCAYDGKEAIEKFYTEDPDLVLLDLLMPNFHGEQVVITIRSVIFINVTAEDRHIALPIALSARGLIAGKATVDAYSTNEIKGSKMVVVRLSRTLIRVIHTRGDPDFVDGTVIPGAL